MYLGAGRIRQLHRHGAAGAGAVRIRPAPKARKNLSPRRKPWELRMMRRKPRRGDTRKTRAFEGLVSPLRGSIGSNRTTHGLRRGLRLCRAYGAFSEAGTTYSGIGSSRVPEVRTVWLVSYRAPVSFSVRVVPVVSALRKCDPLEGVVMTARKSASGRRGLYRSAWNR